MIYFKSYMTEHGSVVAMCDQELIGRVLRSGKLVLDLDKYASFYKGELMSEEEAAVRIGSEKIYSANVVGERSVGIVVKFGLVAAEDVRIVEDVPFVQIYAIV
jgi:uncharacterized protein